MGELIAADFADAELETLARELWLPRLIEEKMLRLVRQGRLSKWSSCIGQEAIAVGVVQGLRPDDWVLPMHRDLGVFTARSVDLDRLFSQVLGKADGFTHGRDRTFHFGSLDHRIVGMISHLGAMVPVADGLALAARLRGEDRVVASFSGDGGTSEGDFHEAVTLAAVWKLPVLFVIENNGYGLSTPVVEQYACADLADRGPGYGIPGVVADGNDVLAVVRAVRAAAERDRQGGGPTLLEFKTFRMRGHEEASGTAYVPPELLEQWAELDPLVRFDRVLDERGLLTGGERAALREELKVDVDGRVAAAQSRPEPRSTPAAELTAVVTAAPRPSLSRRAPIPAGAPVERRYLDAISDGLAEAMRTDPGVVLIGQDIAEYGGAFKVTNGFVAEFGRHRVRNTPIVESGAIGAALGLALDGFRPMVEMQFGDFVTCGFNQIVNNLAKTHYRWGVPVPVVIRVPVGGGMGAGPFHSQNVEAWFTHVPGLKVVAPATPSDAKGLLLAAFDDGNPVLYLEHKLLYRSAAGPVPTGWHTVPIGEASVVRPGDDATIVTYGVGVGWALDAAAALAADGHDVEVIDLRSLLPWDRETVLDSVARTGRALVLHEAPLTGGFGAEVAATIAEHGFESLDAPVARLGGLDTPVPASRALEEITSPRERVVPTLRRLLDY
ncbi:dehydrogenase E1 component subunit alpha/beta [soil metagenome]